MFLRVIISAEKLAEKIQPSDDELKSYYDGHKAEFSIAETQKKIRYVFMQIRPRPAKASD